MNIYFLAKQIGKNYLDCKDSYSRLCNGNFHHIVYSYWVLKNNLNDTKYNIQLVDRLPDIVLPKDIIIFHYETADIIDLRKGIYVQDIGDKPKVEGIEYFITHNKQSEDNNHFFVNFALPANIKKFTPNKIPKNFTCLGSEHSINKEILKPSFINGCKDYGIDLKFIIDKNFVDIETDVFVFLRDKNLSKLKKDDGSPLHPSSIWSPIKGNTHRHANRLYQAWYMNTPLIHNRESPIEFLIKSEYDVLFAETPKEIFQKMLFLKKNLNFYFKMIENCKAREGENNHLVIVDQYKKMFNSLNEK
jgi:hypothetical protein